MPALWEQEAHLCGYAVANGDDKTLCFHEGCWDDRDAIEAAQLIADGLRILMNNYFTEED